MRVVGVVIGTVVLFAAAVAAVVAVGFSMDWLVTGHEFSLESFWNPRFEDLRRETYTHTNSYRQGNVHRLDTLCTQMSQTDDDQRDLYRGSIRHEFADWDTADVPDYLRDCLADARGR